jgi:hypothetical protein
MEHDHGERRRPGPRPQAPGIAPPAISDLRRQFEQFESSAEWCAAKLAIVRVARQYHMRQQTADVLSEARLAMFQRWLASEPIRNPGAYAAQIARSVVRQLRQGLPRWVDAIEGLQAGDPPAMPSFDELVGRSPAGLPAIRGRTQKLILQTVCAGSSLESLAGGRPGRLAILRFLTRKLAERIMKSREAMHESQSKNSI